MTAPGSAPAEPAPSPKTPASPLRSLPRPPFPRLSAIIACYRDAPAVPYMHERLTTVFRSLDVDYEIIFVNDRSPDNAADILAALAVADPHVTVVNHTRNFGSQSAFTSGMRISTGDAVVLLDGDLQDPPELIADFYPLWQAGYDVVYGIRVKREATPFMQVATKAFYRLFRATSSVPVPVDAGDFSLIDRRVVDAMNALPETNRFLRGLRSWVGFSQTGVPYVRPERMFGRTTNSLIRNIGWVRKAVFSFSFMPIDAIVAAGAVVTVLATVAIVAQIGLDLAGASRGTGPGVMPLLLLFLGGVQLLAIGVVGGYLAHVYEEVKRRPPYIVESILNPPSARGRVGGRRSEVGGESALPTSDPPSFTP
jgi:polyisoprenyl-phosphate glycosyltransferase